jgi:ethanolamine ammonia-lyase large subunit
VTAFRCTLGLPGRLAVRLQPNHPTDDPKGIAAAILDGLLYGCGDAVVGINPATDSVPAVETLLRMLDELIRKYESTSFHDSHYLRQVLGLRPAPEFEAWLEKMRIVSDGRRLLPVGRGHALLDHGND